MSIVSGPGSISALNTRLRFSFFFIETLSITGQKNGSVFKMAATVHERDN